MSAPVKRADRPPDIWDHVSKTVGNILFRRADILFMEHLAWWIGCLATSGMCLNIFNYTEDHDIHT